MLITPTKGCLTNKFYTISSIYDLRISHQLNIRTPICIFILYNYAVWLPSIAWHGNISLLQMRTLAQTNGKKVQEIHLNPVSQIFMVIFFFFTFA